MNRERFSPHSHQNLLSFFLLILDVLTSVRWSLKIVLFCISLIAEDGEYFKNIFQYFFIWELPVQFASLLSKLFFLVFLSSRRSSSVWCIAGKDPHSVGCPFTWFSFLCSVAAFEFNEAPLANCWTYFWWDPGPVQKVLTWAYIFTPSLEMSVS